MLKDLFLTFDVTIPFENCYVFSLYFPIEFATISVIVFAINVTVVMKVKKEFICQQQNYLQIFY